MFVFEQFRNIRSSFSFPKTLFSNNCDPRIEIVSLERKNSSESMFTDSIPLLFIKKTFMGMNPLKAVFKLLDKVALIPNLLSQSLNRSQ
jgi:hypothetical protein